MSEHGPRQFGGSSLDLIERHFSNLIFRHNITIQNATGAFGASLDLLPPTLTIQRSLPPEVALEKVGVQLGLLATGALAQPHRWWFEDERFEVARRRDWLRALRWAACYLIQPTVMVYAEDVGWTVAELAAECGVTMRVAQCRHQEWQKEMGREVPFYAL